MMNEKGERCLLACDKICDYCGDCEKYGLLDIPSEDVDVEQMIEEALYQSEREADMM